MSDSLYYLSFFFYFLFSGLYGLFVAYFLVLFLGIWLILLDVVAVDADN